MIDDLTPNQIKTYIKRIEAYGVDGLKGIEIFQAGQLLEFINNEIVEIVSWTNKMILSNPNYEYPAEYPEGERAKYWGESRGYENKRKTRNIIKEFLKQQPEAQTSKELPVQLIEKPKPAPTGKLITFDSPETIKKLHDELKGYFPDKEVELQRALEGEYLPEFLLFPHNQKKFVELFRRLKYNDFILSSPKEIKDWICANFNYRYKKGVEEEIRKFNRSTVHDYLTKDKGDLAKNKRICSVDWLPYKSHLQLSREHENEKL